MVDGDGGPGGGGRVRLRRGAALEPAGAVRRRPCVPLKRRAGRFLEALAGCGNVTMALAAAGLGRDRAYRLRREDAGFAAGWAAALARFRDWADGAEGLGEDEEDGGGGGGGGAGRAAALEADGLVLRRGRGGALQIVSARPNQWSARREATFLAFLAACGNVTAASEAAGFTSKCAWERRRLCPAFAKAWDAAKAEAIDRMEMLLIEEGTNLLRAEDAARRDPQLAMWLLKRRDAEAAGTLKRGRGVPAPRRIEDVRESILGKLSAMARHREKEQLAQGWSRDEEGRMIPPGWVRAAGSGGPGAGGGGAEGDAGGGVV